MRIGILSRNPRLYSTRRLVQAARTQGHAVSVIDTITVAVEAGIDEIRQQRVKMIRPTPIPHAVYLQPVEAIIPRIGASITPYGLAVVRQFEALGVRTTATAAAIACSRDKLHSMQLMAQAGLPTPKTAVIAQPEALFAAVQAVNGLPVVVKSTRGTQGQDVILAHNLTTARAALLRLRRLGRQVLIQEFVAEAAGKDMRVIVVGNRCVAAMQRTAATGEFRANLHLGGTAKLLAIDAHATKLALAAAKAHGLTVAGVDMVHSSRGPLLLEVNSSPGLEGIERATQVDVAGHIVSFLEENKPTPAASKPSQRGRRRR